MTPPRALGSSPRREMMDPNEQFPSAVTNQPKTMNEAQPVVLTQLSRAQVNSQPQQQRRKTVRNGERGKGFSQAEIDNLLTSIEQVLPVSGDEWTAVTSSHNRKWITQKRKEDGLRRKFAKMHTKSVPTGNPHLPLYVKRDKCIR